MKSAPAKPNVENGIGVGGLILGDAVEVVPFVLNQVLCLLVHVIGLPGGGSQGMYSCGCSSMENWDILVHVVLMVGEFLQGSGDGILESGILGFDVLVAKFTMHMCEVIRLWWRCWAPMAGQACENGKMSNFSVHEW